MKYILRPQRSEEEPSASMNRMSEMKKVLFSLSEDQYEKLEMLAKRMGVSKSEALRRAVEIYKFIKDAQAEGAEIRKRDRKGGEISVQILG
jgi:predicted DNA-binding protein